MVGSTEKQTRAIIWNILRSPPKRFRQIAFLTLFILLFGSLLIGGQISISGQFVDPILLPGSGAYTVIWGGTNHSGKSVSAGIYIIVLSSKDKNITKRLTLLDSGNSQPLRIGRSSPVKQGNLLKIPDTDQNTAEIRFSKTNTSTKILQKKQLI